MLDCPGAFREKIHRVISQEISGPVFGQSTLFLFSSPHDSNKGKDIGCLRGVGDGHFNARSLGILVGTEKVYPFPRQAGDQHDIVSMRDISNATYRFRAQALFGTVFQVL